MLFKIAGLFVLAVTARMERAGNQVQWIYENGPNKGYLCALMERDGARFDVYLPATVAPSAGTTPVTTSSFAQVPWSQFATEDDAKNAIRPYCQAK